MIGNQKRCQVLGHEWADRELFAFSELVVPNDANLGQVGKHDLWRRSVCDNSVPVRANLEDPKDVRMAKWQEHLEELRRVPDVKMEHLNENGVRVTDF